MKDVRGKGFLSTKSNEGPGLEGQTGKWRGTKIHLRTKEGRADTLTGGFKMKGGRNR